MDSEELPLGFGIREKFRIVIKDQEDINCIFTEERTLDSNVPESSQLISDILSMSIVDLEKTKDSQIGSLISKINMLRTTDKVRPKNEKVIKATKMYQILIFEELVRITQMEKGFSRRIMHYESDLYIMNKK